MIAWQVRVKNIMKTDALGQKEKPQPGHIFVFISAFSPRFISQLFPRKLTDWLATTIFKRIKIKSIDDGDKFQYLIQAATPKPRPGKKGEIFPGDPKSFKKGIPKNGVFGKRMS
ncbi:hypothetical protein TNIN_69581 [Trichonephila inaurata madagascariensis]|uniref:Uncharacterized protein n=1 Tax=Trichonephila inaurata madagascariensis TaxID=2747483 RepID=A0A8X6YBF1_9ARAC|nr:hypothetical protein TNIN_69581 [Trichonephila inaurata madagascariensis]